MTRIQKIVAYELMMPGRYLMKSQGYPGFYTIYEGLQNPIRRSKLCKTLLIHLKVNRKMQYTFNLTKIRQLNGNHYLKQLYNKRKAF